MSRILHTTILALCAFGLLVPNVLAQRPDDRGGMLGVGGAQSATISVRPDDRAELRGPGAFTAVAPAPTRPDDRAGIRRPGPAPTVLVTRASSSFDWGDAGIGALGAFGIALLLLGATQVVSRTRRGHAAA